MQRYYSPKTGCTYLSSVHGNQIPSDVIEISEDVYQAVIANPAPGKVRSHDTAGQPILIDPPPPTEAALAGQERRWRDAALVSVAELRDRHRDQLEIEREPTLSGEQFTELLVYMQALRDWPQSPDFPDSQYRPTEPLWLTGQTE